MAEVNEAFEENSEYGNDLDANSGYASDFVAEINYYIKEIADLVIKARFQAKETDVRAKYALEFANRAIAEASSAHQVSEALAKTSRMVAALALEFSNNTDIYIDEFIDSCNESRNDSLNTSFSNEESSVIPVKDDNPLAVATDSETSAVSESVQSQDADDLDSKDLPESGSAQQKYQTIYPDTIPLEELPKESNLSTVWEDSESSDAVVVDGNTEESKDKDLKDVNEMKNLEIKRKMLLYRDSKTALPKMNPTTSAPDVMGDSYLYVRYK
jgi:hypothetical protein